MALENLGQGAPIEPLAAALHDTDSSVREAARRALQRTHSERFLDIIATSHTEQLVSESVEDIPTSDLVSDQQPSESTSAAAAHPPSPEPRLLRSLRRPVSIREYLSKRMVVLGAAAVLAASLIVGLLATIPELFSPPAVGSASFGNSQTDMVAMNSGFAGINDELQINLHSLAAPAPGKTYHGWLLENKNDLESDIIPLGRLPFSQGKIAYLYQNSTQQNLLATSSVFLITEEDTGVTPLVPTPDQSHWRYIATISQTPNPADTAHHYSLFDDIQQLLAKDPTLEPTGMDGGMGFWMVRNAGQVGELAQMAQASWMNKNAHQMRNQIIGMLDYLDGTSYVKNDVPLATTVQVPAPFANFGLVQNDPQGLLEHVEFHLSSIAQNPDATSDQKALATQLIAEINKINAQCEMVHQDARTLVKMTDAQLLHPSTLSMLKDMEDHATFASDGSNQQVQLEGAMKVFSGIQSLASFDVEVYKQ